MDPWWGDRRLYRYHCGGSTRSYLWPQGLCRLGDLPGGHHWSGWMQYLLPSQKLWGSLFWRRLWHMGHLGDAYSSKGLWTLLLFLLREHHSRKTSSSVKDRYHFTSSLNSNMLLPIIVAHIQQADYFALPNAGGPWHMPPLFPWGLPLCPCKHKWTWPVA